MTLSILHRATGVAMSVGLIVLAAWLTTAAQGPVEYDQFAGLMSTLIGRLILLGWSFSFFYHLANGLRHLVWDTGRGLAKSQANNSAWFVLIAAIVVTVGFWTVLL